MKDKEELLDGKTLKEFIDERKNRYRLEGRVFSCFSEILAEEDFKAFIAIQKLSMSISNN